MVGFWDRLRGRGADAGSDADIDAVLAHLLVDYPPNSPAYAGAPETLTAQQQDANLARFLDERPARIKVIGDFLRRQGTDPQAMLDPGSGSVAAAHAVDAWLDRTLPKRPFSPVSGDEMPNAPRAAARDSDRSGADIYYSLVADLALLEGESMRAYDPSFDWSINRVPELSDMPSYGRICLMKPGALDWEATVLDMDDHMLGICHAKMAPRGNMSGHRFGELMKGAAARAFDPR
ncbi:hypothetical protein ACMGDM_18955 [Sphingomonas sp. DT-51]|uniref:hypothetical protein n=1 Tax=Sphingomonas sp. DT-51 TaxID=3396165 RepID=UPI003F1A69DB